MTDLPENPIELFHQWYAEAHANEGVKDASAMVLSTATKEGLPSSRMVLLKDADDSGFTLYTNLGSVKAKDLMENPHAALNFYWSPIDKQICIKGSVRPVTDEEADAYFATRPRESQLGAWASKQSTELPDLSVLMGRYAAELQKYEGGDVPRPDFWSGFRIDPVHIEFWEAQPYRLHIRYLYSREPGGAWNAPIQLNP